MARADHAGGDQVVAIKPPNKGRDRMHKVNVVARVWVIFITLVGPIQLEFVADLPSQDLRLSLEVFHDLAHKRQIVLAIAAGEEIFDQHIILIETVITRHAQVDIRIEIGERRQQVEIGKVLFDHTDQVTQAGDGLRHIGLDAGQEDAHDATASIIRGLELFHPVPGRGSGQSGIVAIVDNAPDIGPHKTEGTILAHKLVPGHTDKVAAQAASRRCGHGLEGNGNGQIVLAGKAGGKGPVAVGTHVKTIFTGRQIGKGELATGTGHHAQVIFPLAGVARQGVTGFGREFAIGCQLWVVVGERRFEGRVGEPDHLVFHTLLPASPERATKAGERAIPGDRRRVGVFGQNIVLLRGELAPSCGQRPVVNPDQLFEFSIGQPGHFAGHIFTPTIRHRALKTADGARPGHRAAHRHRRIAYRAKRRFVTHQLDQRTGQPFAIRSDRPANSDGRQG